MVIEVTDRELKGIPILKKKKVGSEVKLLFKFGKKYFVREYKGFARYGNLDGEYIFSTKADALKNYNKD